MPLRVDIATGETRMYREDVRLPGYIPLTLGRTYRSGRETNGPFGAGWRFNLDLSLRVESERLVYAPETPLETVFSRVDESMQARHATGTLVEHYSDQYVIAPVPDRRLVFAKENARNDDTLSLSRIEDGQGNDVHLFFDRGRLVGIVDTVGRQVRFDYRAGSVHRMRLTDDDSSGRTLRTFRYGGADDLVTETDAAGRAVSFGYHDHLMVEYTNRCGGTQYAQYDDERRCYALWYEDRSQGRRFAYDEARSSVRVVGTTGGQTLYRHTPTGQVIERIDLAGRSQNYYYNELEQLVGFSDEEETVQKLRDLDVEEGLFTCVDAEERAAYLEMDPSLRLDAVLDAEDRRAAVTRNGGDRPTALRTENDAVWTFEREDRGTVVELRSPSGQGVRFRRGTDERTLLIKDEEGHLLEDRFDECGRLVERTDALGRRFQWRYDPDGLLKSVRVASQSVEFGYDAEGNVTRIQEATGAESTFMYDAFGRLHEWDDGRRQFQLEYDGTGAVRAIRDADGRTVRYEYDEYGRVTRILRPDGRETSYERLDDGAEVTIDGEDGERRCRYSHGRDPVHWETPDGPSYECIYGSSGALLAADRGDDSFSLSYGDDGRLARAQVNGGLLSLQYDANGQLESLHRDDSSVLQCRRDGRGRPTVLDTDGRRYELAYDAGNRLQEIRAADHTWSFGYDALDCLKEWQGPSLDSRPGSEVVRVSLSAPLSQADRTSEIVMHGAQSGIVLSVRTEASFVPLWGRGRYVQPIIPMSTAFRAAAIVRGEDPLREQLAPSAPFDRREEWKSLIGEGIRWNYTEIPRASEVLRSSWTALDRFFLKRPYYALGPRSLVPGECFGDAPDTDRSPDAWTTGTHVSASLRSSLWTQRRTGPHLHHAALGMKPGRKGPFDLLRALIQTPPWS
ncbi:MAG: DUF6531 domain-containing protein [Salinibacter sp.]|uniref:DUF6531 domain-containing protein n=1 Tax=Salinibacter sp. TaxID=2065818 RepID=UPI0035D46AF9